MNDGVELMKQMHQENIKILYAHSGEEPLTLMDRAACAGYLRGGSKATTNVIATLEEVMAQHEAAR